MTSRGTKRFIKGRSPSVKVKTIRKITNENEQKAAILDRLITAHFFKNHQGDIQWSYDHETRLDDVDPGLAMSIRLWYRL